MYRALILGIVLGVGPIQVGLAVTMLHPVLEEPEWWWLFYGGMLVQLALVCQELVKPGDPPPTPGKLLGEHYVRPLVALALIHAGVIVFLCSGSEVAALARAARPDSLPDATAFGLAPPRHGPPSVGPLVSATLTLIAKAARSAAVLLLRVWLGTPLWPLALVMLVAAIRHPRRSRHVPLP